MLLRSLKYTKELFDAIENDALRDDVAAGRRRLHQSSLSVSASAHLRRIMQPLTGKTPQTGLFHPQRGWSLTKTTGRNPEVY